MSVGAIMGVAAADIAAINAVAAAAIEAVNRVPFPSGAAGILDSYLTGLWGGYSIKKLNGAYTGSCLRVRRSNDNAEQDIGFSGAEINSSSLLSFTGSNSGYVVTWYDQSGLGNDLTQATAANQPLIVDAGVYVEQVLFDGVNDLLTTANSSGTPTALTAYLDGQARITTETTGAGAAYAVFKTNGQVPVLLIERDTALIDDYRAMVAYAGAGSRVNYETSHTKTGSVYAAIWRAGSGGIGPQADFYARGAVQTQLSSSGNTGLSGNHVAGKWSVGASSTSSNYGRLSAKTVLIYEADHNSTTVGDVTTALDAVPITDALDSFTTSLWGLYSLRRQLSGYAGSCIRVRRSNDNAEQDIGFVDGLLDTASLATFVGANSAYVTTWYDQSGGSKNLTQATAANQPRIVNAGLLDLALTFDGTNDVLASPNSGTPSAFTAHFCGSISATNLQVLLEQSPNNGTNSGANAYYDSALIRASITQTTAANQRRNDYTTAPAWQVISARWDRSLSGTAKVALYNSGFKLTQSATATAGTDPAGNFTAHPWYVGNRSDGTLGINGEIDTVVIYEASQADATIAAIARMIG